MMQLDSKFFSGDDVGTWLHVDHNPCTLQWYLKKSMKSLAKANNVMMETRNGALANKN
jgi:hypothetical protein